MGPVCGLSSGNGGEANAWLWGLMEAVCSDGLPGLGGAGAPQANKQFPPEQRSLRLAQREALCQADDVGATSDRLFPS